MQLLCSKLSKVAAFLQCALISQQNYVTYGNPLFVLLFLFMMVTLIWDQGITSSGATGTPVLHFLQTLFFIIWNLPMVHVPPDFYLFIYLFIFSYTFFEGIPRNSPVSETFNNRTSMSRNWLRAAVVLQPSYK